MACSVQCVEAYLQRYTARCTGGRAPTCEDNARVHNGGPEGCQHSDTLSYWQRVHQCCGDDCTSTSSSSSSSGHGGTMSQKASVFVYRQMTWRERVVVNLQRRRRHGRL